MKTKKMFVAFAMFFSSCGVGFAQGYDNFDLSTYKLPDIVRHELDFSLYSRGAFDDASASKEDNFSISGDFKGDFNRYKNTRSFLGRQYATLELGGSYSNNKAVDQSKLSSFDVAASYKNSSRFYKQDQLFFETGGSAFFATEKEKNVKKNTQTSLGVSIPLRVGRGRIEQVEDARQAIYILDNLDKRGVLKRQLSNEEIYTFSQLISTVKNKRFFDSRLRMIDEITTVDSFLVKNNLLATAGAPYFTTLYDYWMYGALFERASGTEISGGLTPGINYSRVKSDRNETSIVSPGLSADVLLSYEKPVNLYWQRSASVGISGRYDYMTLDADDRKLDSYSTALSGKYAWGYYPTSRTNLNMGVSESLSWNKNDERHSMYESFSYAHNSTSAFVSLYYYFSPQLRLALDASLDFNYYRLLGDEYEAKRDHLKWNGNFAATLTYSLF